MGTIYIIAHMTSVNENNMFWLRWRTRESKKNREEKNMIARSKNPSDITHREKDKGGGE